MNKGSKLGSVHIVNQLRFQVIHDNIMKSHANVPKMKAKIYITS